MKTLNSSLVAAVCLSCASLSHADTIVMKNGDKFDGRVISEDAENYFLEIKVSSSIRDERTVAKSDVKSIEKLEPDLKAFEKIEKLVPAPQMLTAKDYEARIEKIQEFITDFPKSSLLSKAKEMISVLEEELAVVSEGGIKFGEEMISPENYMANAYEYDSAISAQAIKDAAKRRDFLDALRKFTKYEITFADSADRAAVASLITQVLEVYGTNVKESLDSLTVRQEKRDEGLITMSPEDRSQTKRALEDQNTRLEAKFRAEMDAKESWITPDVFHRASLEEAAKQVENETRRLEIPNTNTPLEISVAEAYRKAWSKLAGGTDEEKKVVLSEARSNKVPEAYLEKLSERAGIAAQ